MRAKSTSCLTYEGNYTHEFFAIFIACSCRLSRGICSCNRAGYGCTSVFKLLNLVHLKTLLFRILKIHWSFHPDLSPFLSSRSCTSLNIDTCDGDNFQDGCPDEANLFDCFPLVAKTQWASLYWIDPIQFFEVHQYPSCYRGVRAGTRVRQRAAMLSSQRIHMFITAHQRVQSAKQKLDI